MLDCWMSWNERYTVEMAEMVEPHRVYWVEECLSAQIKSTRIVTGEHEYTRYGFRKLLEHNCASIITRGPERVYARPSERPGLGWELEVV